MNYQCQSCGFISKKWLGKCPECQSWNSFLEYEKNDLNLKHYKDIEIIPLNKIKKQNFSRISSNFQEFDRIIGGGLVPGQVILIGGAPGIGKSTLLMQLLDKISNENNTSIYLCAEESPNQIKIRANRLKINNKFINIINENNLNISFNAIKKFNPKVLVIDSIQTIYLETCSSIPGSISQIRECTSLLIEFAKKSNCILFIIGHITKEGAIAGPKILEHMVDTVLYFESEKNFAYRILRTLKNRFGPTNEIAVFEMLDLGLKEITNPSKIFLENKKEEYPGSVVFPLVEGTRTFLVEVQALVSQTGFSIPRRTSQGIDLNRLNILIAILEKNLNINLYNYDIFINIPGGIKISDPAVDLAICFAITSSFLNKPFDYETIAFGEVGLTGEVRKASFIEERIKEAKRLGYKKIIFSKNNIKELKSGEVKFFSINNVSNLIEFFQ